MDTDHTTRPRPRSTPPSSGCLRAARASAATCSEQRDERDRWYEAEAAATNEIISVGIKRMGAIADLYGEDDELDFGVGPHG